MLKSAHFLIALSLLLPISDAGAAPHASFSRGFSSHASTSHASTAHVTAAPARAPSGGFGSFSSRSTASTSAPAQAQTQKSDSALSQQLGKNAAQANALRTLDQRNAAKAAQNAPQAAPVYGQSAQSTQSTQSTQSVPHPVNAPAPGPTTVIVHQDGGGLGHVVAGAMIAHSMNAHAQGGSQGNYYPPGSGYNGGDNNGVNGAANASHGTSLFGLFVRLSLLAVIAWGLWFAWRGWRRRRAAQLEADKPNYSFERN